MLSRALNLYKRIFWSTEKYGRSVGVSIGKGCSLGKINFGTEPYLIVIGNNVQITDDVKFFTHGGGWVFRGKYPNFDTFGKIKIGNNVYIGNNTLIMPGVTIANNVIVGAGSVVTKSISDNCIVAGNPAKIVGYVNELEERLLLFNVNSKQMNSHIKKKYLLSLPDNRFIKK